MGVGVLEARPSAMQNRAARLLMTYRLMRRRSGTTRAVLFTLKTIIVKLPLLVAHGLASWRRGGVRKDLARSRMERNDATPHLALAVTGGVGDFIILARFARDLQVTAGPFVFDVFAPAPKRAEWAFGAVPGFRAAYHDVLFDRTMRDYDLSLRANQMLIVYQEFIDWGMLRRAPRLLEVVGDLIKARDGINVFVQNHPWFDNHLARSIVFEGHNRRDYLQYLAGIEHGGDGLPVATDAGAPISFGLSRRRYVTVHNGFDTGFVVSGRRATKCYPHFGTVVSLLKRRFPNLVFVQVGTRTSELIAECDLNLLRRTTMAEVAGLIAGAQLHLDNESGLVHLASCFGTRCAVVFGPTPADFFGYPGNINIEPTICGNCWWMTSTWMDTCAKGYDTPRCMTEQDPETVAARVAAALDEDMKQLDEPPNLTMFPTAAAS